MAALRLVGSRSAPIFARSLSSSVCGSTVTAGGSVNFRSTPSRPAAMTPARETYGLALESEDLSSTLTDSASWPLNGEATRSAPSRLSGPQAR